MKLSATTIVAIVSLYLLTCLCGCNRTKTTTPDSPTIKVYVTKSGEITLDGKAATLDEVGKAFAALAREQGFVLYSRDYPSEFEPHPNATKVIELVMQNRLPIRMCIHKDFTDCTERFEAPK